MLLNGSYAVVLQHLDQSIPGTAGTRTPPQQVFLAGLNAVVPQHFINLSVLGLKTLSQQICVVASNLVPLQVDSETNYPLAGN